MIPGSTDVVHSSDWQRELAEGYRQPEQLLRALNIEPTAVADLDRESTDFPQRVPRAFVARMEPGNVNDPLLRQVLPLLQEKQATPGFSADPLQETSASRSPGIIHKYHGRVLLITTGACAINCRYCFRRHFPYASHSRSAQQWQESLDYIRGDHSISEVILSGGDPLVLSDARLAHLIAALDTIPHLKRLRIHSRLPVVLPNRTTPQLIETLKNSRLQRSLVIHCNHPQELGGQVANKIRLLIEGGTTVLNQTVLLRGVNDTVTTLSQLSERLFECGILPYYLHLLDRVAGSAHFDLPEGRARQLYRQLMEQLPGYLVPRLVRESPELPYKNPISPC